MYKIQLTEFDEAYAMMEEAFPKSELRPYHKMKERFERGEFVLYGLKQQALVGVILCWELANCVFLENFAVDHCVRGQGYGSIILQFIKDQYPQQIVLLEVEEPYDEISKRRIAFYERNDWQLTSFGYLQPALNEEINEIPLVLMSYPNQISSDLFNKCKEEIFNIVYQIAN